MIEWLNPGVCIGGLDLALIITSHLVLQRQVSDLTTRLNELSSCDCRSTAWQTQLNVKSAPLSSDTRSNSLSRFTTRPSVDRRVVNLPTSSRTVHQAPPSAMIRRQINPLPVFEPKRSTGDLAVNVPSILSNTRLPEAISEVESRSIEEALQALDSAPNDEFSGQSEINLSLIRPSNLTLNTANIDSASVTAALELLQSDV